MPEAIISEPLKNKLKNNAEYHSRMIGVAISVLILVVIMIFLIQPMPTGKVLTSARVFPSLPQACGTVLNPGINYISLNCLTLMESRDVVLNETDLSKIHAMYQYNEFSTDKWSVYAPNLPWYVRFDLNSMSRAEGYIIIVNGSEELVPYNVTLSVNGTEYNVTLYNSSLVGTEINFNGLIAARTSIRLKKGWNLVGFPSIINDTLPEALTNVSGVVNTMLGYNDGSWLYYWIGNSSSNLTNLTIGNAYWLNISQNDYWPIKKNRTAP